MMVIIKPPVVLIWGGWKNFLEFLECKIDYEVHIRVWRIFCIFTRSLVQINLLRYDEKKLLDTLPKFIFGSKI